MLFVVSFYEPSNVTVRFSLFTGNCQDYLCDVLATADGVVAVQSGPPTSAILKSPYPARPYTNLG